MAHGMGKDIWTLTPESITNVVKVRHERLYWRRRGLPVPNMEHHSVHMGHTSELHTGDQPHKDSHHLLLHSGLPEQDIPPHLLRNNCALLPVHGFNDNHCHSRLCSCRLCMVRMVRHR